MADQIKVILPDGKEIELEQNNTALELAKKISEGLARNSVAAEINGEITSLDTVLKDNDKVRIITAKDPEAVSVLRHTTSHVMAQAVQKLFPNAKLAIGPSTETGFYYDFDIPDHTLSVEDLAKIEEEMKNIIKNDLVFERYQLKMYKSK